MMEEGIGILGSLFGEGMADSWTTFLETPPGCSSDLYASYGTSSIGDSFWDFDWSSPSEMEPQPTTIESLNAIAPVIFPTNINFENYGELENRTMLISNVPADMTTNEIHSVFGRYGEIESYDDSNLSRGMLEVRYYDVRSAQWLRVSDFTIRGKPVSRAFAALEEVMNPRKPPNNGTIVIFHLPTETTAEELSAIFSQYGEIRQIRCTPFKQTQRFVEYFDKRAAEQALVAMNGKSIRKSKVSIEFSLPGGFRRNVQKYVTAPTLPTIERVRHQVC
jgi:RNA recognition motif-containing protein